MDDYFDDEEFEEESTQSERQKNLWYIGGFVGLLVLVLVLVIAIEQSSDRHNRRTARDLGKKVTDYRSKKSRKSSRIDSERHIERVQPPQIERPESETQPETQPETEPESGPETEPETVPEERSIENKQAYLSVVRIFANRSAGSGTLLSRKGYFLTNFHVVDGSEFQLIYFSRNPRSSPKRYFTTKIIFGNQQLDIAVLEVVSTENYASLNHIAPVKIGDSSGLKLGDEMYIYGYPGIGGETITLTRGVISGFLDSTGWIKTDANMASGNSGGGAFNSKGELVGVPTARTMDKRVDSQISMIRPINTIKEYISRYLLIKTSGN